jgi:hypothetical protein
MNKNNPTDCYIALKPCGCIAAWFSSNINNSEEIVEFVNHQRQRGNTVFRTLSDVVHPDLGKCKLGKKLSECNGQVDMKNEKMLEWVELMPGLNADGAPKDVVVTMKAKVTDCIAMQRYSSKQRGEQLHNDDQRYLNEFMAVNWADLNKVPNEKPAAPEYEVFNSLMVQRGFRIERDHRQFPSGNVLPIWKVTRPDTPTWSGVWYPWEPNPECIEDSEYQALLEVCRLAISQWETDSWNYQPDDVK